MSESSLLILDKAQEFCDKYGAAFKLKYEYCGKEYVCMFKRVTGGVNSIIFEELRYFCEHRGKTADEAIRGAMTIAYNHLKIPVEEWE